ncbi:DNA polymerase/3'-5' exonuclease PolX [candidate division WOR-3 bacterium]|uniref:DNA polymerase beta n=1 Tax=candidate division WOR-3 bacterium TaxID=2052148 RepID=A0A660SKH7_UNCW3|nr:MAG: DNA polymerase/3'-5' exonuclease PolX [candidate division WOR-3 bacterium]
MKSEPSRTKNKELVQIFETMADALEFKGENPFKVNAYRKAARVLGEIDLDIAAVKEEEELMRIPGIGSGIAKKIIEYLTTGRIKKYEEAIKGIPVSLLELLKIQNLGPKTLALAHKKLKVKSIDDLIRVIENGQLARLPQMGEKKVENIRKGIEIFLSTQQRMSIYEATEISEEVIEYLKRKTKVKRISAAGSLRRMKETIGDIDILATGRDGEKIIEKFATMPGVKQVLAQGSTKGSVILENGRQVDLRLVPPESYGAALQYFTGSKAHNIRLRDIAKAKGMKLNEYGLFKGKKRIAGRTELEIYQALGLEYVPPELREDRGEVELAQRHQPFDLITLEDIKGDLHVHTNYSDGEASIEAMARQAMEMGYEYILITDHSKSAKYAGGIDEERLLEQIEEIDNLNRKLRKFRILKGIEVDILNDGSLDLDDEVLKRLDLVIGAIHSGFKRNVTGRMLDAMDNPHLHIIAHPTGRLISRREGYDVDIGKIIERAAEKNVALELNSYYDRLDLNDINLMRAKEAGVKIAIGTDAHNREGMGMIRFGVGTARRGWLTKTDVLNCLPLRSLLEWRR